MYAVKANGLYLGSAEGFCGWPVKTWADLGPSTITFDAKFRARDAADRINRRGCPCAEVVEVKLVEGRQ